MKSAEQIELWVSKGIEVIRFKRESYATEKQYSAWWRRYFRFTTRLPKGFPPEQKAEKYLTHLALVENVSGSTQDNAFHAIIYFYKHVVKQELKNINSIRAKKVVHLRRAPSVADTHLLLDALPDVGGYPTNFIGRVCYTRGLRVTEPLNIRLKDLNWEQRQIFIVGAKGGKDRVVRMDEWMVEPFQRLVVRALLVWESDVRNGVPLEIPNQLAKKYPETKFSKHWAWLFPAHKPCIHPRTEELVRYRMHECNVQRAFKIGRQKTGVMAVPHEMRHAHATHLLDAGVSVKALQVEMGHVDCRTTMGYCHAEATSVPDPNLILRNPVMMVPALPDRVKFQIA